MEHFENNPRNVKEKSVYLLHLDTPRIIILASVIIGLIILSFLVGMNFVKGDREGGIIAGNDMLFNRGKDINLPEKNIPALPDSSNNSNLLPDEKIVNTDTLDDKSKEKDSVSKEGEVSQDVLTSDNIKDILPPSNDLKKDEKVKKTARKKKGDEKTAKSDKKPSKSRKSARSKKSKKNSKVIEVSKNYNNSLTKSPHFTIQVASFDNMEKADREARSLRDMKYDAHVKSSTVNGKKYYRVKIGPLFAKKKAIKLLNNIQGNYRYRNSYMVKE